MKRLLVGAVAAPFGLLSVSALAGGYLAKPIGPVPSVRVNFADLDVKKESDAQELYDRITYAARRACGAEPDSAHLGMIDRWDVVRERRSGQGRGRGQFAGRKPDSGHFVSQGSHSRRSELN